MSRYLRICATLVLGMAVLWGQLACDDAACEEAADKLRSCSAQVDCNKADPTDRQTCVSAKNQLESNLQTIDGVPCVADAKNLAEQINRCNPNPANYCKCF